MAGNSDTHVIRICEVVAIDTETDSNRIKVRLTADDQQTPVEQLPYAIPLLPMMLHVKPKLHEAVLVLTAIAEDGNSQRYYIGPVISQVSHMYNEPIGTAVQLYDSNSVSMDPKPTADTNRTDGAIPKDDEIAICGRKLSDIILSDNDLRIRCGAKKVTDIDKGSFLFNATSPAYIKLKYHENGLDGINNCESTATIAADKINIIGNHGQGGYNANDTNEFINDENMAKLIQSIHPLPYGDELIKFLNVFRLAFITHTHPISNMVPCTPTIMGNLRDYNLYEMLSDNVRIN